MDQPFHHADPHPANLVVLPNNRICYIDFGAIGRFSTQTRKAWREMWFHMLSGNISRLANAALHFLGPLPPVEVERLTNAMTEIFADYIYASISKDAAWWERSSAQIWLRFVEMANQFGLSVSMEVLQLFRATLLYDSIIIRLDKDFDFGQAYRPYIKEVAKTKREQSKKNRQFGLTDRDYIALEQVADSGMHFVSKIQRGIEEPLVTFKNLTGKMAYAVVLLLWLIFAGVAVVGIIAAVDTSSYAWYGHGIDWTAIAGWGLATSRWAQLAVLLLAMLFIRRLINRLVLPDKRMD
jgi:ubiquinone biosynthesis protein